MEDVVLIDNEVAYIHKNGPYLICEYKNENIDLAIVKECIKSRFKAAAEVDYPTVIDMRKVKSISQEAREYLAAEENSLYIKAGAIVVNSALTRFIGNFFITINRPPRPARLFTNKSEAIHWLAQFV